MKYELIRRHQLGLSIQGPYSRNRRRHRTSRSLINPHMCICAAIALAAVAFLVATFTA